MLVAGALLDGVALRALGLEDLLARLGVTGGSLRERRHRSRAHAERSEPRRRRTATSGFAPLDLRRNRRDPVVLYPRRGGVERGRARRGHGSTELPPRCVRARGDGGGAGWGTARVREGFRGLEKKESVGGAWTGSVGARQPPGRGDAGAAGCYALPRGPRLLVQWPSGGVWGTTVDRASAEKSFFLCGGLCGCGR